MRPPAACAQTICGVSGVNLSQQLIRLGGQRRTQMSNMGLTDRPLWGEDRDSLIARATPSSRDTCEIRSTLAAPATCPKRSPVSQRLPAAISMI
jgi:hypothetical protein